MSWPRFFRGFSKASTHAWQAAHYQEELTVTGKEGKLKGFELVKMVHLEAEQFSVEVRIGLGNNMWTLSLPCAMQR